MSRKERVKVTIDIAKSGLFILLTALFGIFAFVVVHVETINTFQAVACALGAIVLSAAFYLLIRFLLRQLDELEESE
ncbi:hypothetical protein BKN38_02175 [Helicobacter sp. CLO-3]|uniref:hypothetical protein n=1 Tax=unclassified Helicobacter TaxID=2593540 RepID=UPI0008058CEB|nr:MULTISPECIES: hypothetical protein [unclassified Helicobacter]OBV29680.1 hypothetical protein BA723_04405 [Helicobacter sp. CLO-3]OHU84869.1 hypothetical protein BKN38_02175 [Helicobacter sp. CLO-3]